MNQFSISQLSSYAGIKPHTIRVWEQRYGALQPNRSEGNTRYYDSTQLRRLLNIVSLMNGEHRVSELGGMSDKKLFELINEKIATSIDAPHQEYFISQMIAAGISYDEYHFDKMLANCVVRYGMKKAYTDVLYPMLVRIGLMWTGDRMPPANEHFISNLLRQKMFSAIDALPPPKQPSEKWLLFLKEDEFHEIGLLLACYLVRLSGRQVIYLGANVPFSSLLAAIKDTSPDCLLFFLVHYDFPGVIEKYLSTLNKHFNGRRILISGTSQLLSTVSLGKKMQLLSSVDQLEAQLERQVLSNK
jgi:methanogenic corrinoid protein MtbC1